MEMVAISVIYLVVQSEIMGDQLSLTEQRSF